MEQAKVFLGRKDFLRAIGKTWGHDAFDEELGDFLRCQCVDNVVERQYAAECGNRIASQRLGVGIEQGGLLGGAARIVVLDDDCGGPFELGHQTAGGFEIDVVVVGKFLALKLLCGGESRGGVGGGGI